MSISHGKSAYFFKFMDTNCHIFCVSVGSTRRWTCVVTILQRGRINEENWALECVAQKIFGKPKQVVQNSAFLSLLPTSGCCPPIYFQIGSSAYQVWALNSPPWGNGTAVEGRTEKLNWCGPPQQSWTHKSLTIFNLLLRVSDTYFTGFPCSAAQFFQRYFRTSRLWFVAMWAKWMFFIFLFKSVII